MTRAIAGFGLPDVPEPEHTEVPDQLWQPLLSRVRKERITGLAVESEAAGWLTLSEPQASELLTAHRDAMAWCLRVERKLLGLADALDAEDHPVRRAEGRIGGPHRVRGPVPALLRRPRPARRTPETTSERAGCSETSDMCAGSQSHGPGSTFGSEGRASTSIRTTGSRWTSTGRPAGVRSRSGSILKELLDRTTTFSLGGRRIARLDDTGILLNSAMHASLGARSPKLVPLRDVLQVSAEGDVDWDVLSRWAREWHLAAVLQHAFATASATLGAPIPSEARPLLAEAPNRDSRALRAYTGKHRDRGGTVLATLHAIPGLRGKVDYVSALLLPSREFLESRATHPQDATYVARMATLVRWARQRVANDG